MYIYAIYMVDQSIVDIKQSYCIKMLKLSMFTSVKHPQICLFLSHLSLQLSHTYSKWYLKPLINQEYSFNIYFINCFLEAFKKMND